MLAFPPPHEDRSQNISPVDECVPQNDSNIIDVDVEVTNLNNILEDEAIDISFSPGTPKNTERKKRKHLGQTSRKVAQKCKNYVTKKSFQNVFYNGINKGWNATKEDLGWRNGVVLCNLCPGTKISNVKHLKQHIDGKKHQVCRDAKYKAKTVDLTQRTITMATQQNKNFCATKEDIKYRVDAIMSIAKANIAFFCFL